MARFSDRFNNREEAGRFGGRFGGVVAGTAPNPYSPDFSGLTRHEWTTETLGADYAHLDPIDSWTDVAQGVALVATSTDRMTYRTDGELGPAARCAGAQFMENASALGLDWSGGLTVFIIRKRTAFATYKGTFSARSAGQSYANNAVEEYHGATGGRHFFVSDRDQADTGLWDVTDADLNSTPAYLLSARFAGTSLNPADNPVYIQGLPAASVAESNTPDAPTGAIDFITLGKGYNTGFWTGDLFATVVYSGRDMTDAEVRRVHKSLNRRFKAYDVRVLVAGDSVAKGSPTPATGGFRTHMFADLLADLSLPNVVSVGGEVDGPDNSTVDSHEGHSGITVDEIRTNGDARGNMPTNWLTEVTPHFVVLQAGTNDLAGGQGATAVVAEFETLLDDMFAVDPLLEVVVTGVGPIDDYPTYPTAEVDAYNAELKTMVQGYPRVYWVDGAADVALVDDVHPTQAAYEVIADRITPVLSALI